MVAVYPLRSPTREGILRAFLDTAELIRTRWHLNQVAPYARYRSVPPTGMPQPPLQLLHLFVPLLSTFLPDPRLHSIV